MLKEKKKLMIEVIQCCVTARAASFNFIRRMNPRKISLQEKRMIHKILLQRTIDRAPASKP